MMQLYRALVLFVTLSAACGLKCYTCGPGQPCAIALDCPPGLDRCFSNNIFGVVTKGCMAEVGCITPIQCCKEDSCNSETSSGSGLIPPGLSIFPFGSSVRPTVSIGLLLLVSFLCFLFF